MTELTPNEEVLTNLIVEHTKRTRDIAEGVSGWGGKREGSGRKSMGRKRWYIYVTDQEYSKVKDLVEQLRAPE